MHKRVLFFCWPGTGWLTSWTELELELEPESERVSLSKREATQQNYPDIEGVTSWPGLTSQLSPGPRWLLGLTHPPIPRGTVGHGGHTFFCGAPVFDQKQNDGGSQSRRSVPFPTMCFPLLDRNMNGVYKGRFLAAFHSCES